MIFHHHPALLSLAFEQAKAEVMLETGYTLPMYQGRVFHHFMGVFIPAMNRLAFDRACQPFRQARRESEAYFRDMEEYEDYEDDGSHS